MAEKEETVPEDAESSETIEEWTDADEKRLKELETEILQELRSEWNKLQQDEDFPILEAVTLIGNQAKNKMPVKFGVAIYDHKNLSEYLDKAQTDPNYLNAAETKLKVIKLELENFKHIFNVNRYLEAFDGIYERQAELAPLADLVLKSRGIKRFVPRPGDVFDSNNMTAVSTKGAGNKFRVIKCEKAGYVKNNNVINQDWKAKVEVEAFD